MKQTLKIIWRHELFRILFLITLTLFFTSSIIYLIERSKNEQFSSIFDGLWWAIVTMTTVGYGDKVPATALGKLIGFVVMFSGVILVSMFTATISSIFVTKKIKEREGLEKVNALGHIVICGWNKDTERMIKALDNLGKKRKIQIVLINNLPPEKVEQLKNTYRNIEINFVRGDFTRESILEKANIKQAKEVVILPDETLSPLPSDEKTLIATLNIKSLNPKAKVYAHIIDRDNAGNLKRANADEIIISNEYLPSLIADQIVSPGVVQILSLLFNEDSTIRIFRMKIPPRFIGKNYLELFNYLKTEKNYLLLGFISDEEGITLENILSHDYTEIDAFIEKKLKEAGLSIKSSYIKLNLNPPLDYIISEKDDAVVLGNITE
ncbi:voltage-gated potassium channel [Candidatus Kryptobacter tengchongensis]|uniref:potassium channel family protein n=1 Tax=Kryptobacter tengchongensis TaxID=1643429 RepID=UPI0007080FF9|nr:potassium channel family protein [Candidatus Kryptobacter tengchongensis]CUS89296.1 voltage-gated potassium channel [Candidatus Kryptobacter tengchongensis]CUU01649.1 voltage-gated potassium channel [Candidatus Kryptobacter tengchongensis]CUU02519.1 voltage-gated potassium channel [Candidatus Kryptobacter tengchongensis]